MPAVLLDTNALIYVATGGAISRQSSSMLRRAIGRREIFVSPISAWEIGLLAAKQRFRFAPEPRAWFFDVIAREDISVAPLLPEIMFDSWSLPGPLHGDPADRLIIATARHLNAAIVTRDDRILDYAKRGHVKAIAC
ncbi:MAG TPA: type II toxin-antitoxin system VapC family toxin [Stellaceae bacterium]|nr:type II toxin-antitoxin system VapC family toxin [Stellaceae bacterium]